MLYNATMGRAGATVAFGLVGGCLILMMAVLADACSPYGETTAGDEKEAGATGSAEAAPDGCAGSDCACERDEHCADPSARCLSGVCVVTADASDDAAGVDAGSCAACPRGTARMLCVDGACVEARRVFVTSEGSAANLAGAVGADEKCRIFAAAARLGGDWRAWVTVAGNPVFARFEKSQVPYRLLDGRTVALGWTDLVDGVLLNGIDLDEKGARVMTPVDVWTGTSPDGTAAGDGCNGFSTANKGDSPAAVGITGRADETWTFAYTQYCDRTEPRLYCFEQ
jgi:hypothetical protein